MPKAGKFFFPTSVHYFRAPIVNISTSSNKKPVNGIMGTTSSISTTTTSNLSKTREESLARADD